MEEKSADNQSPATAQYIHTVHHLIEECIVFKLSKEQSMEALHTHANILPVITSAVWNELEKENKEFFRAYNKDEEEGGGGKSTVAEGAAGGSTTLLDPSRNDA